MFDGPSRWCGTMRLSPRVGRFLEEIIFLNLFVYLSKLPGKNRNYDLHCWVRDRENGDEKALFSAKVDPTFNGYHEKLRFPPDRDFVLQCEVRLLSR